MDYGEYWLLELAIDGYIPLSAVNGSPHFLESQWARPWHKLARSDLVELLFWLQSAGSIEALDAGRRVISLSRDEFDREIESRRRRDGAKYYRLTEKGGARW